ncbi:hypothetical protein OAM02_02825, partial [Verrucomicrobia bacterium]|nr:hypothetical protein [Verrucomicrobiota bacterium]
EKYNDKIQSQQSRNVVSNFREAIARKSVYINKSIFWLLMFSVYRFIKYLNDYYKSVRFIKNYKIKVIVTCADRVPGMELPLIYAANKLKIKVIIPYTMSSYRDICLLVRKNDSLHQVSKYPYFIKILLGKIKHKNNHNGCMYYDVSNYLALKFIGWLPDDPWIIGSTNKVIVCVDCEYNRQLHLKNRVGIKNIAIVGNYYTSNIKTSNKILNVNKKIALLALPQVVEQNLISKKDFKVICIDWINIICSHGFTVKISLHPHMELSEYKFLDGIRESVEIITCRISEKLNEADIFIAQFSSIVWWANALGIRSIVLDHFGKNFNWFNGIEGVTVTKNNDDFIQALKNSSEYSFQPIAPVIKKEIVVKNYKQLYSET